MASGDAGSSWPRVDRSGVSFRCELHTSWNVPESYVNLASPGVVSEQCPSARTGRQSDAPGVP